MKLYVIKSGQNCKIGISSTLEKRLTAYSTHNPDYSIVETFECPEDVARRVELAVKRSFAAQRVGAGQEWFRVSPAQVVAVIHSELELYASQSLPPAFHGVPPSELVLALLEQIKKDGDTPKHDREKLFALQLAVQREFAKAFELGTPKEELPADTVWYVKAGVDHTHARTACNRRVNADNRQVAFPGMRHIREFFELLPLASGRKVAKCIAIAAMPWHENGVVEELDATLAYAQDIGWACTLHHEWSWYAPGRTALVLLQRTQSSLALRNEWKNSFQRWVIEHKKRLELLPWAPNDLREPLLDNLATEPHLPLSLTSFEEFKEQFWDKFVDSTFRSGTDETLAAIEALFEMWHEQAIQPGRNSASTA